MTIKDNINTMPELSLIVPVYNEEETLPLLFDAICKALEPLARSWEVIFVNDGSRDRSASVLESLF
jgi:glycosyltransferase involved in cell wall biosynthesis